MTPLTDSQVHPLLLPGAVRELVHMCDGKQFREVLPEVQAAMDSIVNDAVQDVVDAMEGEATE